MKQYTITKENRVSNSPYSLEGSNIPFDITAQYPLPPETTTFDADGTPKEIRFILGCKTIDKQEQIRMGYAPNRKPTATERELLTFWGGMLSVPDSYKVLEEYVESAGWFKEKEGPRAPNTRIIYERYDQAAIDDEAVEEETLITTARMYVLKASRATLESLLRLVNPGAPVDPSVTINTLRLTCTELANRSPDFVLKGIRQGRENIMVTVSKAIDYEFLNIDSTGKLLIQNGADKTKFEFLANIPDAGGRHQKIERVVSFFEDPDNKAVYSEIKKKVKEVDDKKFEDDQDDDFDELDQFSGMKEEEVTGTKTKGTKGKVKQEALAIGPKVTKPNLPADDPNEEKPKE